MPSELGAINTLVALDLGKSDCTKTNILFNLDSATRLTFTVMLFSIEGDNNFTGSIPLQLISSNTLDTLVISKSILLLCSETKHQYPSLLLLLLIILLLY